MFHKTVSFKNARQKVLNFTWSKISGCLKYVRITILVRLDKIELKIFLFF